MDVGWERFYQYFEKLGRLLGQAESIAPTLVIHPLRSAYTLYRFHDGEALRRYDDAFLRQVEQWKRDGLLYHFGDETMLAKLGSVDGGKLVLGRRRYDCVILPDLLSIDGSTAALLRRFVEQGGRLCVLGIRRLLWTVARRGFHHSARPSATRISCDVSRFGLCRKEMAPYRPPVWRTVRGSSCTC